MKNVALTFLVGLSLVTSSVIAGPKEDYDRTLPTEWDHISSLMAKQNLDYREFKFSKPEVFPMTGPPPLVGNGAWPQLPLDVARQVVYYASSEKLACKIVLTYQWSRLSDEHSGVGCSARR